MSDAHHHHHHHHDVGELARRAKVNEGDTKSVLKALSGLIHERAAHAVSPTDPEVVEALIERAKAHPLGTEFLFHGSLDSVAASFKAHAFTIEAAREKLRMEEAGE